MGKSIQEFYEEVQSSEKLQNELKVLLEQKDKKALIEWAGDNGCEASAKEAKEFFEELQKSMPEDGELSPDDLEQASGGTAFWLTMCAVAEGLVIYAFACDSSSSC